MFADSLGGRLRALRKERGLSQEAVARGAGMGLKGYSDLELGHALDPHISTLRGIARALGVSVKELVEEPEAGLVGAGKDDASYTRRPETQNIMPEAAIEGEEGLSVTVKQQLVVFINEELSRAESRDDLLKALDAGRELVLAS